MKSLLKSAYLNPLLRFLFKFWSNFDAHIRSGLINRIRISGEAKLQLDELEFKMYSDCDDGLVDFLYFKPKEYEEISELRLFKLFAKNSSCILDIGANTGLYSIISKKANPKALLYAFEPYIINENRLRKNLDINNIRDLHIVSNALGDENKEIAFAVPVNEQICPVLSADTNFTRKFFRKWVDYKDIQLTQIRLDDFLAEQAVKAVDLMKIDVENYELNVLRGAFNSLEVFRPIIFMESFVDEERETFFEKELKPRGYFCYAILKEGLIRLDNLQANPDSKNFIFCKARSSKNYLSYSNFEEILTELKA